MNPPFYVLFADPNPHIGQLLQRELRSLPCKTEAVCRANALIKTLSAGKQTGILPDLLVLDPDMPDMPRKDLLKFLHEEVPLRLVVLHAIHVTEWSKPDFPYTNHTVLIEKSDSSPQLIREIVEGRIKKQTNP